MTGEGDHTFSQNGATLTNADLVIKCGGTNKVRLGSDATFAAITATDGLFYTQGYSTTGTLSGAFQVEGETNLGPDIVLNGTFEDATDWTEGSSFLIADGVANYDGLGTGVLTENAPPLTPIVSDTNYLIEFDFTSSGSLSMYIRNSANNNYVVLDNYSIGHYSIPFLTGTLTSDNLRFLVLVSSAGTIDNVSVKKLLQGSTVSGALTGKTSMAGDAGVGANELRNGTFDSSSYWGFWGGSGSFSVADGRMYYDDLNNEGFVQWNVNILVSGLPNTSYRLIFDLDIVSGAANMEVNDDSGHTYENRDWFGGVNTRVVTTGAIHTGGFTMYASVTNTDNEFWVDNLFLAKVLGSTVSGTLINGTVDGAIAGDITTSSTVIGTLLGKGNVIGNTALGANVVNHDPSTWDVSDSSVSLENNIFHFDGGVFTQAIQLLGDLLGPITHLEPYRLSFTVSNAVTFASIYFINSDGSGNYGTRENYTDGDYTIDFLGAWVGEGGFAIESWETSGDAFDLPIPLIQERLSVGSTVSGTLTGKGSVSNQAPSKLSTETDTLGWYKSDLDNITLGVTGVNQWDDLGVNSNDLIQTQTAQEPPYIDGKIVPTGSNGQLYSDTLTFSKPFNVYYVLDVLTWQDYVVFFDASSLGNLYVQTFDNPLIRMWDGGSWASSNPFSQPQGRFILRVKFDGTNSEIQINDDTPLSISVSDNVTPNRVRLDVANIAYEEMIVRDVAEEEVDIYTYLSNQLNKSQSIVSGT